MRTTKELLIIVRDNLEKYLKSEFSCGGICSVIHELDHKKVISLEEDARLNKYIKANKPRNAYLLYRKYHPASINECFDAHGFALWLHWWTPHKVKPRIKYLNKLIEKL